MKYLPALLLAVAAPLCAAADNDTDYSIGATWNAIDAESATSALVATLPAIGVELRATHTYFLLGAALYGGQDAEQANPFTTLELDKGAVLKVGARYPFNDVLAVYAWAGASYFSAETVTVVGATRVVVHDPGVALLPFGAGITADLGEHARLDAGWSRLYDADQELGSGLAGDLVLDGIHGGVSYVF